MAVPRVLGGGMDGPRQRKTGVLIGGSGLIGGTLLHHFKTAPRAGLDVLSPNSKELSLRVPSDIESYFERVKPDFVINCAIAAIDSDPQLALEVNCLGSLHLARAAHRLGIPYVHISSGAVMPSGHDIGEEARLPLDADLSNYAKGKLIAELALEHMHATQGLDYTSIRLGIVYGAHDHKIQGFQHLVFSIVDQSMPVLLTRPESAHSYTNARKLPAFVAHVIENRDEFSAQTYHFVDREPVRLGELILTIKSLLGTKRPRAIYVPYRLAKLLLAGLTRIVRMATWIGIEARPPAEAIFLKSFYESQVLSSEKLRRSSFVDRHPEVTVFSELPGLLEYYVRRWQRLNLIERRGGRPRDPEDRVEQFRSDPERLLAAILAEQERPLVDPPRSTQAGRS